MPKTNADSTLIAFTTKMFYTEVQRHSVSDAPGNHYFIKNMVIDASQADMALVVVPSDGSFTTAIAKGGRMDGKIQGQSRQLS